MIGLMEVFMLPLFDSWSRTLFSVSLFILLCPTLSILSLGMISY